MLTSIVKYLLFLVSLFFFVCLFFPSWLLAAPLILEGAPVGELAGWVSATSNKPIVLPDAMAFKVWLHVPESSPASALSLLRSTAQVNGWEMSEKGGIISFTPRPVVLNGSPSSSISPPGPLSPTPAIELVTKEFPLLHRVASDLLPSALSMAPDAKITTTGTNSLLLTASQKTIDRLTVDLPALDTEQFRYRVEAIITEQLDTLTDQQGVNLAVSGSSGSITSTNTGTVLNGAGVLAQFLRLGDFSGLYAFLVSSSSFNVLSTPSLLLDDGQRALLHVGDNVPIVTGSTIVNGQITTTYTRQDVGLILSIALKTIGDHVQADILQEASSVAPTSIDGQVVTSQRKITTRATIKKGEILDLGGLTTEDSKITKTGVPGLRSLPFVGWLFRGEKIEKNSRTLRVYLMISKV